MPQQDIYLNHAGTSWPKPDVVADAVQQAICRSPGEWGDQFTQAHELIAAFFGLSEPGQLLLTPGCTSSLAVGIADMDLAGRSRVLTSAWEHHAMHRPLLKLAESGIALECIPPSEDSPLDLGKLEFALSRGDVGLVAITAAANVTGDLLPYESVIELARQYDTQVLLDAAQVVGWLDLDFADLGADVVAFGGHKGLQGPWGIGGLYIAASARMTCAGVTGAVAASPSVSRPGYCDVGSVDQIALAGLQAAIGWLNSSDRPTQLARARAQLAQLETTLTDAGVQCFGNPDPAQRMPTLAVSPGARASTELAASLRQHGITVGSGLQCAPLVHRTLETEAHGLIRISVGPGQSDRDLAMATEVLLRAFDS